MVVNDFGSPFAIFQHDSLWFPLLIGVADHQEPRMGATAISYLRWTDLPLFWVALFAAGLHSNRAVVRRKPSLFNHRRAC